MTMLENSVVIRGSARRIFELAVDVESWPDILPHYRRVAVLAEGPAGRRLEMAAWRGRIPVKWQALQTAEPDIPRIWFRHVRGFTRGMEVQWHFLPVRDGTETVVTITHDLGPVGNRLRRGLLEVVIAPVFIDHIASRTLGRMKQLIEETGGAGNEAAEAQRALRTAE